MSTRTLTFLRFKHEKITIFLDVEPKDKLEKLRSKVHESLKNYQPDELDSSTPLNLPESSKDIIFFNVIAKKSPDHQPIVPAEYEFAQLSPNSTLQNLGLEDGQTIAFSFQDKNGDIPEPNIVDPALLEYEDEVEGGDQVAE